MSVIVVGLYSRSIKMSYEITEYCINLYLFCAAHMIIMYYVLKTHKFEL